MAELVHATAVRLGTTGILLVGPSGSGKSMQALSLMTTARLAGHFAALVSDDQIFLESRAEGVIARGPASIRGLIELRGGGIGRVDHVESARMHHAVELVSVTAENRIPPENRVWSSPGGISLPLLSMDRLTPEPFGWLSALIEGFPTASQPKV